MSIALETAVVRGLSEPGRVTIPRLARRRSTLTCRRPGRPSSARPSDRVPLSEICQQLPPASLCCRILVEDAVLRAQATAAAESERDRASRFRRDGTTTSTPTRETRIPGSSPIASMKMPARTAACGRAELAALTRSHRRAMRRRSRATRALTLSEASTEIARDSTVLLRQASNGQAAGRRPARLGRVAALIPGRIRVAAPSRGGAEVDRRPPRC